MAGSSMVPSYEPQTGRLGKRRIIIIRATPNLMVRQPLPRYLDLSGKQMDDDGTLQLAIAIRETTTTTVFGVAIIQYLDLSYNCIGDVGAMALAEALHHHHHNSLMQLKVSHNSIGDRGAKALACAVLRHNHNRLIRLDLSHNQIGCYGTIQITKAVLSPNNDDDNKTNASSSSSSSLKYLDLQHNWIGYSGVLAVANMLSNNNTTSLKQFGMGNVLLQKEKEHAIFQLMQAFWKNTTLTTFNIGTTTTTTTTTTTSNNNNNNNNTTNLRILKIFKFIQWLRRAARRNGSSDTATLDLNANRVSSSPKIHLNSDILTCLSWALQDEKAWFWKSMDLSFHFLGNQGVMVLANAFSKIIKNTTKISTIVDLNLSNCGILDQGAYALAKALVPSSVQRLNLSGNHIGNAGALQLVQTLFVQENDGNHRNHYHHYHSNLIELNLNWNAISEPKLILDKFETIIQQQQQQQQQQQRRKTKQNQDKSSSVLQPQQQQQLPKLHLELQQVELFSLSEALAFSKLLPFVSDHFAMTLLPSLFLSKWDTNMKLQHMMHKLEQLIEIVETCCTTTSRRRRHDGGRGGAAVTTATMEEEEDELLPQEEEETMYSAWNLLENRLCESRTSDFFLLMEHKWYFNERIRQLYVTECRSWELKQQCQHHKEEDEKGSYHHQKLKTLPLTVEQVLTNCAKHEIIRLLRAGIQMQRLTLRLSNYGVDDKDATILAKLLQCNELVLCLYLDHNRIGNRGACELGKALQGNNKLEILYLEHNAIGDDGILALAEGLQRNQNLTRLHLENNQIGNTGASAIGRALRHNTKMKELYLGHNHIEDEGVLALAEGLEKNERLLRLCLKNNHFGKHGLDALLKARKSNKTLWALDVSNNNFAEDMDRTVKYKGNQTKISCITK